MVNLYKIIKKYQFGVVLAISSFMLAILSYKFTGNGLWWGVTGAESQIGGVFWSYFGFPVGKLAYYNLYKIPEFNYAFTWFLVFGIILGSFFISAARKEFSIRQIPNRWMALKILIGGFLIGYGTRMAGGCNIGDFYSGFATGSAWAFPFFLTMVLGIYSVSAFGKHEVWKIFPAKFSSNIIWPGKGLQAIIMVASIILIVILVILGIHSNMVELWLIFGIIFGVTGYIGSLCFQTSFRETISGSNKKEMVEILSISLLIFSILSQIAILGFGMRANFFFDQSESIGFQSIGGYIFGLGMGLAFNCTYSMEWRMGSGNMQAILAFLGLTFLGAPAFALTYSWWHYAVPQIVMPASYWQFSLYRFGIPGAILIDIFPILWFLYAKRFKWKKFS